MNNLEIYKNISIQHGLPLQFVIKEVHVFDILSQITAFATLITKN